MADTSGRVTAPEDPSPFETDEMPEDATTAGSDELLGGPPEGATMPGDVQPAEPDEPEHEIEMTGAGGALRDRTPQDDPDEHNPSRIPVMDPEPRGSKAGERQARKRTTKEKPPGGMNEEQARSALEIMLSTDAPPLPDSRFNMADLAQRLKDEGVPVTEVEGVPQFIVELRGLSERELQDLDERSRREPTREEREDGAQGRVRDQGRYWRLMTVEALIEPDLSNAQVLAEFGPTPEHVVRRWFLPGETTTIAQRVMQLSGFSDNALVAAKN